MLLKHLLELRYQVLVRHRMMLQNGGLRGGVLSGSCSGLCTEEGEFRARVAEIDGERHREKRGNNEDLGAKLRRIEKKSKFYLCISLSSH